MSFVSNEGNKDGLKVKAEGAFDKEGLALDAAAMMSKKSYHKLCHFKTICKVGR